MLPVAAALLVVIGFFILNYSGMVDVNSSVWWWDAFELFCVLFVLFMMLGWLLRIERRQPMRKFVP